MAETIPIKYAQSLMRLVPMAEEDLRAELVAMNLPLVAGGYNVGPRSRNRLFQKWLGLKLNLGFLWHTGALHLVPYALGLFLMQVLVGSHRLRRIRYLMHRRNAANLRAGGAAQG